jgi:hypothetical protein
VSAASLPLTHARRPAALPALGGGRARQPGARVPLDGDPAARVHDRPAVLPLHGEEERLAPELGEAPGLRAHGEAERPPPPVGALDDVHMPRHLHGGVVRVEHERVDRAPADRVVRARLLPREQVGGGGVRRVPRPEGRGRAPNPLLVRDLGAPLRGEEVVPAPAAEDVRALGDPVARAAVAADEGGARERVPARHVNGDGVHREIELAGRGEEAVRRLVRRPGEVRGVAVEEELR